MKLAIFSDVHNEFGVWHPPKLDADVVILAGDIHSKHRGAQWAIESFDVPVIYVPGNHEYYGSNIGSVNKKLKEQAQKSNVHVLLNESINIDGVNFIGSTLWTDFKLFGEEKQRECSFYAGSRINDYERIRLNDNGNYRKLRTADTQSFFDHSVSFIEKTLAKNTNNKTVIVTHHAPSRRSTPQQYKDDLLSASFSSNLEKLIAQYDINLWIHGHTHHNVDYMLSGTRVVSNQRGYAKVEENTSFCETYIIEI